MLVATTHSILDTALGQSLAIVVSAAGIGLFTYVTKKARDSAVTSKENAAKLDSVLVTLIGEKPSDLNPFPPEGLVRSVIDYHTNNDKRLTNVEKCLEEMGTKVDKLFPNGENTNDPGDLMARNAKANGTWLDNPPAVPMRRRSDKQ